MRTRTLPSGTVTFLFTDVEGSTRLLERLGDDAYETLLAEHHRLLRGSVAAAGGVEVGTEGDAFFVAFERASDALRCVLDAQRGLQSQTWPGETSVPVRMGLHTGEARPGLDDYVGLAVHQAARIAAAAHGGQVLVSETTKALADGALPEGASLADLGPHRLKDLTRPVRLYELRHPDLASTGAAPRTLDARRHNLPIQPTPFTGRHEELTRARKLVSDAEVRLVTLTGPGGMGKTRLALQAAAECVDAFADGVWFVALAPLTDAAQVPAAVAAALGAREGEEGSAAAAVLEHVAERDVLLVLDNVEHVVGAAPFIAQILAAAPGLKVLATSRQPLRISAEHVYQVPPMELSIGDAPAEAVSQADAVRFFVERARAADPDFTLDHAGAAAAAEICRRLDGLPLAIELAAARVRHLGVHGLLERVRQSLDVLGGGPDDAPDRHRTLEATIGWSYDLLDERLRRIFRRLSVFAGGWDVEAAQAVCAATLDDLGVLVDHSLVRRDEDATETRFDMLETIRGYARSALDVAGGTGDALTAHAGWFAGLASRGSRRAIRGQDGPKWLNRLAADHDNLRTAMDRLWDEGRDDDAARMAADLVEFWRVRGHFEEGAQRLESAVEHCAQRTSGRARALVGLARLQRVGSSTKVKLPQLEEALSIAEETGDEETQALTLYEIAPRVAKSDAMKGFAAGLAGDVFTESPKREGRRGRRGQPKVDTKTVLERALEIAERTGDEPLAAEITGSPFYQTGLRGFWRAVGGDPAFLSTRLEEAQARGDRVEAASLLNRRRSGSWTERETSLVEALAVARETGDVGAQVQALRSLAEIEQKRRRRTEAADRYREALHLAQDSGSPDLEGGLLQEMLLGVAEMGDRDGVRSIRRRIRELPGDVSAKTMERFFGGFASLAALAGGLRGWRSILTGAAWAAAAVWLHLGTRGVVAYVLLAVAGYLTLGSMIRRTGEMPLGRIDRERSFPAFLPAAIAFATAVWLGSIATGGVLISVFLLLRARGLRDRGPVRIVMALMSVAAIVVCVVDARAWAAPLLVLAGTVVGGAGYQPWSWPAGVARCGSAVARTWTGVLMMGLLAVWRTGGAFDLGPWYEVALVAVPAGVSLLGVALAASWRGYLPGGLLLAVSAPFAGWGISNITRTEPVVPVVAAGVAWTAIGVARRFKPRERYPLIDL